MTQDDEGVEIHEAFDERLQELDGLAADIESALAEGSPTREQLRDFKKRAEKILNRMEKIDEV